MRRVGNCSRCGACCRPPVTLDGAFCPDFVEGTPPACAAYEDRPGCCRDYPKSTDRLDPTCTYRWVSE